MARRIRSTRAASRWRLAIYAVSALLAACAIVTALTFVWPATGIPPRVSAIVVLGGPGERMSTAVRLARAHRALTLVISTRTSLPSGSSGCEPPIPGVRVICFNPIPPTTRGEAEYIGLLARRYHWRSLALVTVAPQNTRARLRFERCFSGRVYAVDSPLSARDWPHEIGYEWGAMIKALLLQRSC